MNFRKKFYTKFKGHQYSLCMMNLYKINLKLYKNCQEYKRESMMALSIPRSSLNKLPLVLFLQLNNNCGGNNKNCYLFSFTPTLIAKNMFTPIFVSFLLVVGSIDEYIDGSYLWEVISANENTRYIMIFAYHG